MNILQLLHRSHFVVTCKSYDMYFVECFKYTCTSVSFLHLGLHLFFSGRLLINTDMLHSAILFFMQNYVYV